MQENNKDLYFVAVKIFLENGKGEFLITRDRFDCWDIPGGRLRPEDFNVDLSDIVKRKMREELGADVQYELHEPVVYMRHERNEMLSDEKREKRRIFAIGYRARYLEGDIKLGKNHEEYRWVDKSFDAKKYFDGGWLKGIQEYCRL